MMYGLLTDGVVDAVTDESVAGFIALPDGVGLGWQQIEGGDWRLPTEVRAAKVAELHERANAECGRRVTAAYGSADKMSEVLYRLNNSGSLSAEDTERGRLVDKCDELKATINALADNQLEAFDVTDNNYWGAS